MEARALTLKLEIEIEVEILQKYKLTNSSFMNKMFKLRVPNSDS